LALLEWLAGEAFAHAALPKSTRRFRIATGAAVVVSGVMMVAKSSRVVVFVSADHALVRVDGGVYAVAANKPLVLSTTAATTAVSVRYGGCRLAVVPAGAVPALLDSTGATNVCYRPAAPFAGFVEAVLVSGPHWACGGCGVLHRHLDAMWAHLGAPGPAPTTLSPLMPSPPLFGSPMTIYAENTVAVSAALNQQLHARLHSVAAADKGRHGGSSGGHHHPCGPDRRADVVVNVVGCGGNGRGGQGDGGSTGNSHACGRRQYHKRSARGGHGPRGGGGSLGGASGHNRSGDDGGGGNRRNGGRRHGTWRGGGNQQRGGDGGSTNRNRRADAGGRCDEY